MVNVGDLIRAARDNPAPLSAWEVSFLRDMERRQRPTERQMTTLANIAARVSFPDLARRLAERMADLATTLAGDPSERGRTTWRWRPHGSLVAEVAGPKRGTWCDHAAGGIGGDALGFVAHMRSTTMQEAAGWAVAWLGEDAPALAAAGPGAALAPSCGQPEGQDARKVWSLRKAHTIWGEAVEPAGTLAATYLASRGLALPGGEALRFHPNAWRNRDHGPHGPAMVALMTAPETGDPVGTHVTYLRPDGAGKAEGERVKVMLGAAGLIRLTPDEDVTAGLGLAEGIETSLAVMQRAGWSPVWCATSAGAVAKLPVLPGIEALTIFADHDKAGLTAARECALRWAEAGRKARILTPPAGDWDDATMARGEAAA